MIMRQMSRLYWVVAALAIVTLAIHCTVGGRLSGLLTDITLAVALAVVLWDHRPRKWVE